MSFDVRHDTQDVYIGQAFRTKPKQTKQTKQNNYQKFDDEDEKPLKTHIIKKNFTDKVIKYRRDNNLTQQQLAQKLNVKLDVIKQIEKGTLANPDCRLLNKINKL